jgi:hypothetical protein
VTLAFSRLVWVVRWCGCGGCWVGVEILGAWASNSGCDCGGATLVLSLCPAGVVWGRARPSSLETCTDKWKLMFNSFNSFSAHDSV